MIIRLIDFSKKKYFIFHNEQFENCNELIVETSHLLVRTNHGAYWRKRATSLSCVSPVLLWQRCQDVKLVELRHLPICEWLDTMHFPVPNNEQLVPTAWVPRRPTPPIFVFISSRISHLDENRSPDGLTWKEKGTGNSWLLMSTNSFAKRWMDAVKAKSIFGCIVEVNFTTRHAHISFSCFKCTNHSILTFSRS